MGVPGNSVITAPLCGRVSMPPLATAATMRWMLIALLLVVTLDSHGHVPNLRGRCPI